MEKEREREREREGKREKGVVISLGDTLLLNKLGKDFLIYSTRGESRILQEKEEDEKAMDPSLPS